MPKTTSKKEQKTEKTLTDKYRNSKKDTGSIAVQIAQLSERIVDLSDHLKKHQQDKDSRRGLLILVGKRRRLLNYLSRIDETAYAKLVKDLGLRK